MANHTQDSTKKSTGRAKIVEVAHLARVSPATVSRVTNGLSSVDKKLAKKVWQAVEELGYVPNPQARALVSGRSRVLGLLISEITNPFYPELIQSFEDYASENDFEVMMGSVISKKDRTRVLIRRMVQRRVEGVAVMTFRAESDYLEELIAENIPLVMIDVGLNAPRSLVIEIDYAHGIDQAVQHLAVLGHRRIGFVSGPLPAPTNEGRRDAFFRSAQKIGLTSRATPLFEGDHTFEGGMRAAHHFLGLTVRPTAIMCSNDLMAIGVLRVLAERGVAVPGEMSVVGFDDIHLAEFANPPLSSVRMSRDDLAHMALKGLMALTEGEITTPHVPLRIKTHLVVRKSTDSPKVAGNILKRKQR